MARLPLLAGLGLVLVAASAAPAEEVKAPINAAMLLSVMAQPSAPRGSAIDESLRDPGPPPPRRDAGPGVTIVVRNPCPPGDAHYEPPPLPGRRARH